MNARLVTVLAVISMLVAAGGCGSVRNVLFGRGAACGVCPSAAPNFNVSPPAYGAPAPYANPAPTFGSPGQSCPTPGCGGPGYSAPAYGGPAYGDSCGCGGEGSYYGDGSYYGGYGGEMYPGGTVIGTPMIGTGISGGYSGDAYNLNNWIPADPNYVPGSAVYSDGSPAGSMVPVPRGS